MYRHPSYLDALPIVADPAQLIKKARNGGGAPPAPAPASRATVEDEFNYIPGDYKVGKKLGEGAFGSTVVVRDKRSGYPFVVKNIPKTKSTAEDFHREVNILKSLKSICGPHILCYVGTGKEDGGSLDDFVLITEYLGPEYTTLESYIKNIPDKQRWTNIRPLFVNLVLGLEDWHSSKGSHRDIKPSNLMVNPTNGRMHIKIIDAGLSCLGSDCSDENNIAGTPAYFGPEISMSKITVPINLETWKRMDYWALAVSLIEYILGERMFSDLLDQNISIKDMLHMLPPEFIKSYPDIYSALEHMMEDVPSQRRLPSISFSNNSSSTPTPLPPLPSWLRENRRRATLW